MKKYGLFVLVLTLACFALVSPAFAAASSGDEIWTKLAGKAAFVGQGLRRSGYIIGGMGLIFFSFMAIFNKISWKNLAYIMLSCFVLSFMVALINWFSTSTANPAIENVSFAGTGADSSVTFEGGTGKAEGTQPSGK